MKKLSFMKYAAGMLGVCLTLALAACSDDDNYTPGEPTAAGAVGAYFDSTNSTDFILTPDQESIELTVSRNKTESAVEVPITATGDAATAVEVPATVSFAAGESTQTLTIGVKGLETKKQYTLNLAIGESQADHYAIQDGTTAFSCTVAVSEWKKLKENIQFYYYSPYLGLPSVYSDLWQLDGVNNFYLTNFLGSGTDFYFTLNGTQIDFNDPATFTGEVVPVEGKGATVYDYGDYGYKLNYVVTGTDDWGYNIYSWNYEGATVNYFDWYGGYNYKTYSWLNYSEEYFYFYGYASSSAFEDYAIVYGVWE